MKTLLFRTFILSVFVLTNATVMAQSPTIGLLHHDENVSDGYTLFTPEYNSTVYLIDNCGDKVNEWQFSEQPGLTCYLLEDGTLLRAGKDSLELRDWQNTLLWSYPTTNNGLKQHHDIEPLPNGNVLLVVTQLYTDVEIEAEGRDTSLISGNFKFDKIVELQPIGADSAAIVWEWRFIDHVIQDYDSTKPNYGIVEDHPELIDLNYDHGSNFDWTHINGIDYNPALDQIVMSSKNMNELYIIDHSTDSVEVNGHTGGNANRGGDFLWRWGNPLVYRQGGVLDQTLFDQHDPKWVLPGYLDEGKISVYNNGGDGVNLASSIHLIEPDMNGFNYNMASNNFLPVTYDWSWSGSILGGTVYSNKKCGTHQLPNGNFIITETYVGQFSEITKAGDHLWTYRNPTGYNVYNQYAVIPGNLNSMFRAEKYPPDYPGFAGQDLSPKGIIEDQNVNSDSCLWLGVEEDKLAAIMVVNPVTDGTIRFNETVEFESLAVLDLSGKTVLNRNGFIGAEIAIDLPPGVYFLRLSTGKAISTRKIIVL